MIYSDVETLPREELRALQLERLKSTVERCYHCVDHYRKGMDELGVLPRHIQSLEDIRLLPFTKKDDLRRHYPFGMFATPMENVLRIHASSGTTGKPTVVGYTRRDLETWGTLMARSLAAAGLKPGDRMQNAYGYGLFTGGLGFHQGAEMLGMTVTPISGGQTQKQIMLMQDFEPDCIACTPSYALNLVEQAEQDGVDLGKLPVRVGVFGAEPWSEGMRYELESRMGIDALDVYGLSELIGPGVSQECVEAKKGLHVWEDHFLVEVLDPDSGKTVVEGEQGELVFTSLTKEAFPILRYATRDISRINKAPCKCGRTHARMDRITGRSDDMLIIRGVNVYPSQVESVVMKTEALAPFYQIEVFRDGNMDTMTVNVEANQPLMAQGPEALERVAKKVTHDIKDFIGVSTTVNVLEPNGVPRSQGKAVRVIDHRKKE